MNTKHLYTILEAAETLGVGRTTIYQFINSGKIKIVRIGKRGVRISSDEIDRFILEQTPQSD